MELVKLTEVSPEWGLGGFLDVETTGLNPNRDEIIELAIDLFAYERQSGKIQGIVDEYIGFREPSCPIPYAATRVHGITKNIVKGHVLDQGRVEALLSRAEFLVAHNSGFDRGFMRKLFPMVDSKHWYCSMSGINWYGKGYYSRGLQNLLQAHHISVATAHRAGADVQSCLLLLSQMNEAGTTYLLEMLQRSK